MYLKGGAGVQNSLVHLLRRHLPAINGDFPTCLVENSPGTKAHLSSCHHLQDLEIQGNHSTINSG
jgi:hypothetical protein